MTANEFLDAALALCEQDDHDCGDVREALSPYLAEADAFDVAEALYWYGADYHTGQWSLGYALLSAVGIEGYRPSPLARGCEPGGLSEMMLEALVACSPA